MFREQKEKTENVAHVLLIQGKWHIINLNQKKRLFVKNLDMSFIQDNGILKGWPGFSCAYQHSHRAKGNADLTWRCLSHQAYIRFKEFWAYDLQPILKSGWVLCSRWRWTEGALNHFTISEQNKTLLSSYALYVDTSQVCGNVFCGWQ